KAEMRIALSGTPIMNNTFDLYAQLEFLVPGLLGKQDFVRKEYAEAIDKDVDENKINMLHKITHPFILHRTKQQVASDLPDKTESILWCKMGTQQMLAYNKVKESIRDSLFLNIKKSGVQNSKLNVLQGILRLRQMCGSPQLIEEYNDIS